MPFLLVAESTPPPTLPHRRLAFSPATHARLPRCFGHRASIGLDWERTSRLYLGVVDHYQQAEASFMNNPFLFAWPMMLGAERRFSQGNCITVSGGSSQQQPFSATNPTINRF